MDERSISPSIEIRGAVEHNLKNIDVDIPRRAITVISGVSGAGKSTLVFDVIFKEAQRRYLNTMSLYTRKLLQEFSTPRLKSIRGLSPALSLAANQPEQTTVGELTGLDELWRILLVAIGQRNCPEHGLPTTGQSPTTIVDNLIKNYQGQTVIIAAPLSVTVTLDTLRTKYLRIINGAKLYHLDELDCLPTGKISVVIDVLKIKTPTRLLRTVEQCLTFGKGYGQLLPDNNNLTIVSYFSSITSCPQCGFSWPELDTHSPLIAQHPQAINIAGKSLTDIRNMSIDALYSLATIDVPIHLQRVIQTIRSTLLRLQEVNLDYLTLSRTLASLATGEQQKIRIVSLINEDLNGVIYLFDEPSQGLNAEETTCLWQLFVTLKKQGNTVIIVDHQRLFFEQADLIIELGPAAGVEGGQVLATFTATTCADYNSPIALLLADSFRELRKVTTSNSTDDGFFTIVKPTANNLRLGLVNFARRAITVVSGASGSGKSTLVRHCLYRSLADGLLHDCQSINGADDFDKVSFVDRRPLSNRGPNKSMVITQLGLFAWLRQLFGQLRDSQLHGLRANDFSLQTGKGRCQYCRGHGYAKTFPYLPATLCTVCGGRRYNNTVDQITYRQRNISSVLELSIAEAEKFFFNFKKTAKVLTTARLLGLGYIVLGQRLSELSAGEWQRLKLVPIIAKATSDSLIILDEPASGLHYANILPLMQVLHNLTIAGTTVVIVEHNPLVIANSNWQIELGPGGGPYGGQLLYCGKPKSFVSRNS